MLSSMNQNSARQAVFDEDKMQCVRACVVCYQTCQECGYSSLVNQESRAMSAINRLLDCASICMASALLIARESDLATQAAGLCIQACDKCIDSVADMQGPRWQECLLACADASANCREYVASREPE